MLTRYARGLAIAGALALSGTAVAAMPGLAEPTDTPLQMLRVQYDENPGHHLHHRVYRATPRVVPDATGDYSSSYGNFAGGYVINRQGYGNYVRGPDGSLGGYAAGSDGAIELQHQQEDKCRYVPETC